jgi:catechol 2,3-dioxygenase-like lactoylglutathione lyase family enzyme
MRVQLALNVKDLDQAVEFYSKLFDAKVNKRKPGYANFAIDRPPLKLVLFENPAAEERLNHLGVEVFDDAEVHAATDRLKAAPDWPTRSKTGRPAATPRRTRSGRSIRRACAGSGTG